MRHLREAFSEEDLLRVFDVLTQAETDLRLAPDPRVTLELALLKLVQMRRLMPFVALVDRVDRVARGGTPSPPPPSPPPVSRPTPFRPRRDLRRPRSQRQLSRARFPRHREEHATDPDPLHHSLSTV